jgi:LPS sulfotransferase NodH
VRWKRALNDGLRRATGYEVRRAQAWHRRPDRRRLAAPPRPGDRLVESPAFILCSPRSGSTLLRVILNSHSQIHAPPELHVRSLAVEFTSRWGYGAMLARGLDTKPLEYLLWDRVLHRELTNSGKEHIVVKTPNDVFGVRRILECWPDARFIFLLRHPAAIVRSRVALRPRIDRERNCRRILRFCEALERARRRYPGHTVRYEDLTEDPQTVTQGVCEFLGVPWEAEMLDYGRFDHGEYDAGVGDWADKIRSGRVQPAEALPEPEEVPPALRDIAAAWGYLPDEAQSQRSALEAAQQS